MEESGNNNVQKSVTVSTSEVHDLCFLTNPQRNLCTITISTFYCKSLFVTFLPHKPLLLYLTVMEDKRPHAPSPAREEGGGCHHTIPMLLLLRNKIWDLI